MGDIQKGLTTIIRLRNWMWYQLVQKNVQVSFGRHCRQTCCFGINDSRKPHRGERRNGKSSCKLNKFKH